VKRFDDPNFLESAVPKSASEADGCLVAAILPVKEGNRQRKTMEKRSIEEEVRKENVKAGILIQSKMKWKRRSLQHRPEFRSWF